MKPLTTQSLLLLITIHGVLCAATPSTIGVIQSSGEFRVDGAPVLGNTTLRDGSVIETSRTTSKIELAAGASMTLDRQSTATVYRDRVVLRQGAGVLRNSDRLVVNARTLRISSDANDGVVRVALNKTGHVVVTAQIAAADLVRMGPGHQSPAKKREPRRSPPPGGKGPGRPGRRRRRLWARP